jgi:hypothetical protein
MQRTPPHRAFIALLVAGIALVVLIATGCAPSLPSDPPGITGTVTSVVSGDERPASFLVEGPSPQPTSSVADKALVSVPPATVFFGADGTAASLQSVASITKGTKVRVWFEGAVAESYPVQGSAKAVQILGN